MLDGAPIDYDDDLDGAICAECLARVGEAHAPWCEDAVNDRFASEQREDEIADDFRDWGTK